MSHYRKLSAFAIALAAFGTIAYAAKGMENDGLPVAQARIPMAQAVAAAEQHVNGKKVDGT